MSTIDLGVCAACGLTTYLTSTGAMRSHAPAGTASKETPRPLCDGSGKSPRDVIRR